MEIKAQEAEFVSSVLAKVDISGENYDDGLKKLQEAQASAENVFWCLQRNLDKEREI